MFFIIGILSVFAQETTQSENVFEIRTEIPAPKIYMFINNKDAADAYNLQLTQSFTDKILESLKKEPF